MKEDKEEKIAEEKPEEQAETPKDKKEECGLNFMELLNDPLAKSLLGGCKDIFKKEKTDPDICEISIKAPSAVVLKLFKVSE